MSATPSNLAAAAARALNEGATFRAVRRARLMLPDREAEFATRTALEDALRTADFGDAGRLIVVRSLTLKGLPRGASGPRIARTLERAWQTLAPSAAAFDAPGAEHANVVYFRSIHDARLAWLRRFAHGGPPAEWFWSHAVPELAGRSAGAAIVPLLVALRAAAPQVLAREIDALARDGVRRVLVALPAARVDALLEPAAAAARRDGAPHLEQVGTGSPARSASPSIGERAAHVVPLRGASMQLPRSAQRRAQLSAQVSAFGASDWRVNWLAAQLVRAETGEEPTAELVAELVREVARQGRARAMARGAATAAPAAWAPAAGREDRTALAPSAPTHERSPSDAAPRAEEGAPAPLPGVTRRAPPSPAYPWLEDNAFTAFGGLLMLLNALEVLHFPAWLELQDAALRAQLARTVLSRVARRLRMPHDDVQQALLRTDDRVRVALPGWSCGWNGFRWPRAFDDGNLLPGSPAISADESLRRWQWALVRLLRRDARIGLAHLVLRPAGVSITSTHVDVVLPLAGADADVRRTGLDRDPGWVAWFGWIVAFHYIDGARDGAG